MSDFDASGSKSFENNLIERLILVFAGVRSPDRDIRVMCVQNLLVHFPELLSLVDFGTPGEVPYIIGPYPARLKSHAELRRVVSGIEGNRRRSDRYPTHMRSFCVPAPRLQTLGNSSALRSSQKPWMTALRVRRWGSNFAASRRRPAEVIVEVIAVRDEFSWRETLTLTGLRVILVMMREAKKGEIVEVSIGRISVNVYDLASLLIEIVEETETQRTSPT